MRQLSLALCIVLAPITASADYIWLIEDWSPCQLPCDGYQTRSVDCVDTFNNNDPVPDEYCTAPVPAREQVCNVNACSWMPSAWGACSEVCGGGVQTRELTCIDGDSMAIVADYCTNLPPPGTSQACNEQPCATYSWSVTGWSVCSVACGGGTQTREVTCLDGSSSVVSDTLCELPKPDDVQACNLHSCPVFTWYFSDWDDCSTDCGGGTQQRSITCLDEQQSTVAPENCSAAHMPLHSRACNEHPCQESYWWDASSWSPCSHACGTGMQYRIVQCRSSDGAAAAEQLCAETKPADVQECNAQPCGTYAWYTGPWDACSHECGGGVQARVVACRDDAGSDVDEALCTTERPEHVQLCNVESCPAVFQWFTSSWQPCSAACGVGTQTRDVACLNEELLPVEDHNCQALMEKPVHAQSCNLGPCDGASDSELPRCEGETAVGCQQREAGNWLFPSMLLLAVCIPFMRRRQRTQG